MRDVTTQMITIAQEIGAEVVLLRLEREVDSVAMDITRTARAGTESTVAITMHTTAEASTTHTSTPLSDFSLLICFVFTASKA